MTGGLAEYHQKKKEKKTNANTKTYSKENTKSSQTLCVASIDQRQNKQVSKAEFIFFCQITDIIYITLYNFPSEIMILYKQNRNLIILIIFCFSFPFIF